MTQPGETSTSAVAAVLAGSAVFGLFGEAARARLVGAGSPQSLEAGEILCQAGDAGDAAYVVLEGELEVRTTSAGGRETRFVALGPGAIAGEMAALDGGPRSADMTATRRTKLWRLPRVALVEALEGEPKAAVGLIAELSRRLRVANAALESAALLDLGARLAVLLLEERGRLGRVAMTQTEMARRVGASREKVNRKLHGWVDQGWVRLDAGGVHILAADDLQTSVNSARRR